MEELAIQCFGKKASFTLYMTQKTSEGCMSVLTKFWRKKKKGRRKEGERGIFTLLKEELKEWWLSMKKM